MKIRTGFVSNSSSSSFIIKCGDLSQEQYFQIKFKLNELAQIEKDREREEVTWKMYIDDYDFTLHIYASMDDDFEMEHFLSYTVGVHEIESRY
jgi:hypothetical protein